MHHHLQLVHKFMNDTSEGRSAADHFGTLLVINGMTLMEKGVSYSYVTCPLKVQSDN